MIKNKFLIPVASVAAFVATALMVGLCQAQTTTWSVASTTLLGQAAESNASGNAYNMYLLIVPITLGLAAAYFALRWVWHRIAGRH